jgi:hypothetical protein
MKTVKWLGICLLALLMTAGLGSCGEDEYTSNLRELIIRKELNFKANEQEGELVYTTTFRNEDLSNYLIVSDASWCHVSFDVEKCQMTVAVDENNSYDEPTCLLDENIPVSLDTRNDTYVLIIGNQKYRFASDVTYAIHDARVFREYCERTLGIPALNIHVAENATKQMISEEEMEDWLGTIQDREKKRLIIYYAGHGVPDTRNQNKSYLLPTDVRGENPKRGIALDDFYAKIGSLDFAQATIFMDACFSGVNRSNDCVTEGMRGVEIEVDETPLSEGRLVVFSAAQGNETAQGYPEQGHGLFT